MFKLKLQQDGATEVVGWISCVLRKLEQRPYQCIYAIEQLSAIMIFINMLFGNWSMSWHYLPSFAISIYVQTSVPTTLIYIAPAQVGVRPVSHSAIPPLAVVSNDGPERVGQWPDYPLIHGTLNWEISKYKTAL